MIVMFFRQLGLLLWKNFVIRKRHPLRTVLEIVWPILLFSILVSIRLTRPSEKLAECHYPARALPSAGVLPWIETMFCNLDNPCFNVPVASETPGQINDPPTEKRGLIGGIGSVLDTMESETNFFTYPERYAQDVEVLRVMIREITKPDSLVKASFTILMGNSTQVEDSLLRIGLSQDLATTVLASEVTVSQVTALYTIQDRRGLVCNYSSLGALVSIPSTAPLNASETSDELCSLGDDQLNSVWNTLLQGADLQNFLSNEVRHIAIFS